MKIFLKQKNTEKILAVDIGRSAVKALLFEKNQKNGRWAIKKNLEEELNSFGVFSGSDFQREILRKTLKEIFRDIEILKCRVVFTFGPEFLQANVFKMKIERKIVEEKIEKEEFEKIQKEIEQDISRQLFSFIAKKMLKEPDDFQILSWRILEENIDGYFVKAISGLRGKTLEFKVLTVFGLKLWVGFLEDILRDLIKIPLEICHEAEGLLRWRDIETTGPENKEALKYRNITEQRDSETPNIFVDIGSWNTQIFFFDKILEAISVFETGGEDFAEKIQKNFGFLPTALSALEIFLAESKITLGTREKITHSLADLYEKWVRNFQEKISQLQHMNMSSREVVFWGGGTVFVDLNFLTANTDFSQKNSQIKGKLFDAASLAIDNESGKPLGPRMIPALLVFYKYK